MSLPFTFDVRIIQAVIGSRFIKKTIAGTKSIFASVFQRLKKSRTPSPPADNVSIGSVPVIIIDIPDSSFELEETSSPHPTPNDSSALTTSQDQIAALLQERAKAIDRQNQQSARIQELEELLDGERQQNDLQEEQIVQQTAQNKASDARLDRLEANLTEMVSMWRKAESELEQSLETNASLELLCQSVEKKRDYYLQALLRRRQYYLASHQVAEREFFESRNILSQTIRDLENKLEIQEAILSSLQSNEDVAAATRRRVECEQFVRQADERSEFEQIKIKDLQVQLADAEEKLSQDPNQPVVDAVNLLIEVLEREHDLEAVSEFYNSIQPTVQLATENIAKEAEIRQAEVKLWKEYEKRMTDAKNLESFNDDRVPPMQAMMEAQGYVLEKFIQSGDYEEINREKAKRWYLEFEQNAKDEAALKNLVPSECEALAIPHPDNSNEAFNLFYQHLVGVDAEALRVADEVNRARHPPDQLQYLQDEGLTGDYLGDPHEHFEHLDRGAFTESGNGVIDQHIQNVLNSIKHPLRASSSSQSDQASSSVLPPSSKAKSKQRIEQDLPQGPSELHSSQFDPTSEEGQRAPAPGLGFSSETIRPSRNKDMFRMNLG